MTVDTVVAPARVVTVAGFLAGLAKKPPGSGTLLINSVVAPAGRKRLS